MPANGRRDLIRRLKVNGQFCPLNTKTQTEALHSVFVLRITIMANCVCTYVHGNINGIMLTQCKFGYVVVLMPNAMGVK